MAKIGILSALILVIQANALLIEQFTDNQIDYVPGLGLKTVSNGYLYTYTSPTSTVSVSELTLQAGTAFSVGGGLPITFNIGAGTAADLNPYAGVGFDWVNSGTSLIKTPINLTGNTSVIVQYASTTAINLEWAQGDAEDGTEFVCVLPNTSGTLYTHTCSLAAGAGGFAQPSWVTTLQTKVFNLANAIGLKFSYKTAGTSAQLVLLKIWLNNELEEWPALSSSSAIVVSSSSAAIPPSSSSTELSSSSAVIIIPSSSSTVVSSSSAIIIIPSSSSTQVSSSSAIIIISSSSGGTPVGTGIIWNPTLASQVNNPVGPGGYWYSYTDAANAGASVVSPVSTGMIANIAANNALQATFTLATGYQYPFAAIGFDWNDNGTGTAKLPSNISAKTGICIDYELTDRVFVSLKQAGTADNGVDFFVTLPATAGLRQVRSFPFTTFALPTWATTAQRYTLNLAQQTGMHFQYKERDVGSSSIFRIHAIGFDNSCGAPIVTSSSSTVVSSSSITIPSSSSTLVSSSGTVISSSSPLSSSSGGSVATCNTPHGVVPIIFCQDDNENGIVNWADDHDGNGIPNYLDPTSPYQIPGATSPILGTLAQRGFGFVSMSNRELVVRLVDPGHTVLQVFSLDGRLVATPFSAHGQGEIKVPWAGYQLKQGVYLFRLIQGQEITTVRGVLVN